MIGKLLTFNAKSNPSDPFLLCIPCAWLSLKVSDFVNYSTGIILGGRGVPIGGVWGGVTPPHSSVLSAKFAAVGKFKGRGNEKGEERKEGKEKEKRKGKERKENEKK